MYLQDQERKPLCVCVGVTRSSVELSDITRLPNIMSELLYEQLLNQNLRKKIQTANSSATISELAYVEWVQVSILKPKTVPLIILLRVLMPLGSEDRTNL